MQIVSRVLLALLVCCITQAAAAQDIAAGATYWVAEGGNPVNGYTSPIDVRYGRATTWVTYASLAVGAYIYCTATEFGIDPAPGYSKSCYWLPHNPSPPPAPATAPEAALTPAILSSLGVTPAEIMTVMGFGFGAVIFMWFGGFWIGAAITAIRKL